MRQVSWRAVSDAAVTAFRGVYQSARRRSRLTLAAAAAFVVVAGVLAGVLTSLAPAAGATSHAGSASQAVTAHSAGHQGPSGQHPGLAQQHGRAQHSAPAKAQQHAPAKAQQHAPAKAQQPGRKSAAPAKAQHHVTPPPLARNTPDRPYYIYDSVTPTAIPAEHHTVATYANGAFAASASQVAGRHTVLWIDTNGSDPRASVLDVEPGDATPAGAASWAWQKLHAQPDATALIYTMRSEWPAVISAINSLPSSMNSHVRYWIADPTGVPHMVPGASATQWYWGHNFDISTASPSV